MSQEIISKVWQIAGIFGSVKAGLLIYENGKVSYVTEEGVEFAVPLAPSQCLGMNPNANGMTQREESSRKADKRAQPNAKDNH